MSRAAWPTVAEFKAALQAAGVLSYPTLTAREATFDYQGFLDAALDEFQHHTGLEPFLQEAQASVRRYDPPGPTYRPKYWSVGGGRLMLLLDPPYQTVTEVKVFDDIHAEGGTVLVEDQDYVLEPVNRQEDTRITAIRFRFAVVGQRHSVKVTGKCGHYTAIPESIWQAVLAGAAARLLYWMREGIVTQPTDWREGDSAEKYNVETLLKLGASMRAQFDDAVKGHLVIRL